MTSSQEDHANGSLEQTNKRCFFSCIDKLMIVSVTVPLWDTPTIPRRREKERATLGEFSGVLESHRMDMGKIFEIMQRTIAKSQGKFTKRSLRKTLLGDAQLGFRTSTQFAYTRFLHIISQFWKTSCLFWLCISGIYLAHPAASRVSQTPASRWARYLLLTLLTDTSKPHTDEASISYSWRVIWCCIIFII